MPDNLVPPRQPRPEKRPTSDAVAAALSGTPSPTEENPDKPDKARSISIFPRRSMGDYQVDKEVIYRALGVRTQ